MTDCKFIYTKLQSTAHIIFKKIGGPNSMTENNKIHKLF